MIYVSDAGNNRIQTFSPATPAKSTSWGRLKNNYR